MSRTTIKPHEGIPSGLMWMLAIMAEVSVANLYYCQPLLNMIRDDLHFFQLNTRVTIENGMITEINRHWIP